MLKELAQTSHVHKDCQLIFATLRERLECPPDRWRNIYKALTVIEFVVTRGSEYSVQCARRLGVEVRTIIHITWITIHTTWTTIHTTRTTLHTT
jgi:hypothetical protein